MPKSIRGNSEEPKGSVDDKGLTQEWEVHQTRKARRKSLHLSNPSSQSNSPYSIPGKPNRTVTDDDIFRLDEEEVAQTERSASGFWEDDEDLDDETVAKILIVAPKSPGAYIQSHEIHQRELVSKERRKDKTHLSFDRSKMNGKAI